MITSMIYSSLLLIHILGACLTGIVAAFAGVIMWQRRDSSYRSTSIALGALGGFEVLTGTLLSVISSQITSISLCENIITYLFVVLFVEILLFMRMRKVSMLFPIIKALSPIATGLILLLAAIAYGF
jgi:hypothetical protein